MRILRAPFSSAPGRSRTPSLLIRSQTLYPIELRAHVRLPTPFARGSGLWQGGQGDPTEAYRRTPKEGRPPPNATTGQRPEAKSAHDRTRTCTPFRALVPQTSLSTNSSTWARARKDRARPAQETGHARGGTRTLTGLPPQDPESCASTNSATRASMSCRLRCDTDGAEGSRTPDLLNAIQALSQLSYGPAKRTRLSISSLNGADGTRTRGLRCDRPAL